MSRGFVGLLFGLWVLTGCGPVTSDVYRQSEAVDPLKIPAELSTPIIDRSMEVPLVAGELTEEVDSLEQPPNLLEDEQHEAAPEKP